MQERGEPHPGAIIRSYREEKGLSEGRLAEAIGVSQSLVHRIETEDRGLTADVASRLDSVLHFAPDDRQAIHEAFAEIDEEAVDAQIQADMNKALSRIWAKPLFVPILRRAEFLYRWGLGRIRYLRSDMAAAIPLLEHARDSAEASNSKELLSIILADTSGAYAASGLLDLADSDARKCEALCNSLFRDSLRGAARRRGAIGLTRAIVLRQEIEYLRGNVDESLRHHLRAQELMSAPIDNYASAKSFYFLALLRFWQGLFQAADELCNQALLHARRINPDLEPWMFLRDGFFVGDHWMVLHGQALKVDILALQGKRAIPDDLANYELARRGAWWSQKKLPPLTPRYEWLVTNSWDDRATANQAFRRWIRKAQRLGISMYLPDMLISYGDYCRVMDRDELSATRAYEESYNLSTERGFNLFKEISRKRLQGYLPDSLVSSSSSNS